MHLLHRFRSGPVQTGLLALVNVPIDGDFGLLVGVPVRVQAAPAVRIDLGGFLGTRFADRGRDRHAREDEFQSYDHYLPQYWEYRTVRMKFDGLLVVPWYSSLKRSILVSTPSTLSAA